ncbi:zinc ribbon domain-containing protein [Hungatella sp.]|uniref:zinc ribbon domain-containing protein n=1 Tax=Hungatella sp. TaxID=2613924 RepID=UPI002A7EE3FF|nr:zinc ribbon domain-containing protein [Hungatella sp.]
MIEGFRLHKESYERIDGMICPKCGHETSGNYCNNCGEPLSTGYLMESAEEYEIRKRLSEELAGLEEQAAASTPPVMEGQKSQGDWTVKSERSEEKLLTEEWLNTEEPPFIKERMESDGEAYVDDGTNADDQPFTDDQSYTEPHSLTEPQSSNPAKSIIGALALLKSRHLTEASSNAEDQQSYENQSDDTNLLNNRGRRNSLDDTEADDNVSYQPRSRRSEKQKPKEKTPKSKKSKEGSEGRKAESKGERKEQQKKEARMKKLEGEVERLRSSQENGSQENDSREKVRPVSRKMAGRKAQREESWDWDGGEHGGSAYSGLPRGKNQSSRSMRGNTDSRVSRDFDIPDSETRIIEKTDKDGVSFGDVVVKSMVTATVIISRVMQLASFLLMAGMVFLMAQSFWEHGQALGDIRFMAAESNYGMALYVGFAGITLFMGLIWCLWIPSKTGAGGGVRMKKYDTGRGFVPFLLCMAAVVAAAVVLPEIPVEAEAWKGMAKGAAAAMEAVNSHRDILFLGSTAGAVLSLVRKLLRV